MPSMPVSISTGVGLWLARSRRQISTPLKSGKVQSSSSRSQGSPRIKANACWPEAASWQL